MEKKPCEKCRYATENDDSLVYCLHYQEFNNGKGTCELWESKEEQIVANKNW